ncbi:hypothetical protein RKE38_11325 [Phycicoccus sp. M110.8]|uniref:hypothetical protein n=1 Tax=Phycicoccus sp. M110.8 TaxID=3075433 RepID=UPI0028FD4588|nr:hypothetical protein [Phycicoccus sp. M110.8]MDU0314279.1 hypothetical protein [Phycicoccus sp. M110.8]
MAGCGYPSRRPRGAGSATPDLLELASADLLVARLRRFLAVLRDIALTEQKRLAAVGGTP